MKVRINSEQAKSLGLNVNKDTPFTYNKFEGWNITKSINGLVVEMSFDKKWPYHMNKIVLHGRRTMCNLKECGYHLEGYVSLHGKQRRAFTTSVLIEIDGVLCNVGCLGLKTLN